MRTLHILFIILLSVSPAYSRPKKVTFTKIRVEHKNDSLHLSFDIESSKGIVSGCQGLLMYPKIYTERNEKILPPVEYLTRKRAKTVRRKKGILDMESRTMKPLVSFISPKNQILRYSVTIPYEEWMMNGNIGINEERVACNRVKTKQNYRIASNKVDFAIIETTPVNTYKGVIHPEAAFKFSSFKNIPLNSKNDVPFVLEDFYILAAEYEPGSEPWKEIILLCGRLHPTIEEAAINASAVLLGEQKFDEAYKAMELFKNSRTPEMMNNLAIWYLYQKDYEQAKQLFLLASFELEEAKNNYELLLSEHP